ncbi:MAG: hypothetical protein CMH52_14030 [Myxococcales bacterium]|nr:hypothetical protein [Myxococcales bacterium]
MSNELLMHPMTFSDNLPILTNESRIVDLSMNFRHSILFGLLIFSACRGPDSVGSEPNTPDAQADMRPLDAASLPVDKGQATWPFKWSVPDVHSLDVRQSEKLTQKISKKLKQLCSKTGLLKSSTTDDFKAKWVRVSSTKDVHDRIRTRTYSVDESELELAAFNARWRAMRGDFLSLTRCKVKVFETLIGLRGQGAWLKADLFIEGIYGDGQRYSLRGQLGIVSDIASNRFRGLRLIRAKHRTTIRTDFENVTQHVGAIMARSQESQAIFKKQLDSGLVQTVGGLSVIDWNADGRDDLMAWDTRRLLQIFVNDGQAGFNSVTRLIPAEAVGLHMVLLDLNSDGQHDLVSSQLVGCEAGEAWFGLYQQKSDGFKSLGKRLKFKTDCNGFRARRYQHIATSDVDGDGDLDIFFAGFAAISSSRNRGNVYQTNGGLENLLFLNRGQHRYREVARAGGFAGEDQTYVGKFFDMDEDGDDDLLTVNDFGVNRTYENLGRGRFREMHTPGLSDNGQSMGVSVVDVDGDQTLDVYISNMYSYAGNRIVPLVQKDFKPDTYKTLFGLTQGNTYYKKAQNGFKDHAREMGLAHAGWAWGQAVFDIENDGDLDIYVANGNATHSDARAPDY